MKKSEWITIAMTTILFIYGYMMSQEGHDHSAHHNGNHNMEAHHGVHRDHTPE